MSVGTGVAVGGIGVAVGGTRVGVGGTGVAVGGTGVAVGGIGVGIGAGVAHAALIARTAMSTKNIKCRDGLWKWVFTIRTSFFVVL